MQLSRFWSVLALALLAGCSNLPKTPTSTLPPPGHVTLPTFARADFSSNHYARDLLLNDGWRFLRIDPANPKEPANLQLAQPDATWRTVDLPHDYSIEGPFDQKWASGTAYLPAGIGWYQKSFTLPAQLNGKSVAIRFDGVYQNSEVWINGHSLGKRPYGYSSFTYDLTPHLKWDAPNTLSVRVDHSQFADSRWYPGSGIYRNVFLVVTDKVHVDTYGTFIRQAPGVTPPRLDVSTSVRNDTPAPQTVTVLNILRAADGREIARRQHTGSVTAGQAEIFETPFLPLPKMEAWSPDHPYMHRLETRIYRGAIAENIDPNDDSKVAGQLIDTTYTPFGYRTFVFDPNTGFTLNGQSMKLKGVCLHEDAGALGAAIPVEVWQRRFQLLKDMGCNAIRTSHNPPAPEFLDLCDQMGFLVMDEAFDEWTGGKNKWVNGRNQGKKTNDGYHEYFNDWCEADIRTMVTRDRNHPSIILWSIGNEIDYLNDPFPANSAELATDAERLINALRPCDNTRPITAACAAIATNMYYPQLDVVGYNYQENRYITDHTQTPARVIIGSENSLMPNAWLAVKNNDFISGQFLWTGIDYLGEAGAWPNRGSGAGLIDLAGFPKPSYYQRKTMWGDQKSGPAVTLMPTPANGRGRGGGPAATQGAGGQRGTPNSIRCYTNCDMVELFLNGQSMGRHVMNHETTWDFPFSPYAGRFHVVGASLKVRDGEEIISELCSFDYVAPVQASAATNLHLLPDKTTLAADGQDIAQIEVNVTDAKGILADAAPQITVNVTGPARLLGIENGDQSSHESYQAPQHHAFHGKMLIYLKTAEKPGTVNVEVTSAGLATDTVSLTVR